jgi:hypothetical protein
MAGIKKNTEVNDLWAYAKQYDKDQGHIADSTDRRGAVTLTELSGDFPQRS